MLVRALPAIAERVPEVRLVVAGDAAEPAAVEARRAVDELGLGDRVEWQLRFIGEDEIAPLMERSTLCVLPYRKIDSSGVLATALGHGRPAVVTDVGGLPDAIREFGAGRVVPPDDPAALADACVGAARRSGRARAGVPRHRARAAGAHVGRGRRAARGRLPGARCVTGRVVKDIGDRVLAAVGLVVLSPVLAGIAAWIAEESGRPVLFRQPRAGRDGTPFSMLKFRTMVPDAIEVGRAMAISDDPFGVVADDPRITRSGRFLRRTSLDELPQLVNVLRGEMSIVGPRPDLLEQAANYTDGDRRRLAVKPGITGWAQIHGRDEIPWEERFELDAWYVDNWSLALDARIVLATFTQLGRPDPEPVEDTLNIERARASRDQVPGHVPGGPSADQVPSEGSPARPSGTASQATRTTGGLRRERVRAGAGRAAPARARGHRLRGDPPSHPGGQAPQRLDPQSSM